jgi:hypothetical protein
VGPGEICWITAVGATTTASAAAPTSTGRSTRCLNIFITNANRL